MVELPRRPWPRRTSIHRARSRPEGQALTPTVLEGDLRIAYVVWDWPALSQTFVVNEIRELMRRGHDVVVYYKETAETRARLTFDIEAHQVDDAEALGRLLVEHDRQVMHSPFAYPSTTLLVWPASLATGLPFTFMAGGVDVAHYTNMKRNRVGAMASSPGCLGVVTLGTFHRDLLLECGVPSHRIVMERQSAELPPLSTPRTATAGSRPTLISVGRFIEKKGLEYLVRAAARLPDVDVVLYGYGPLEDSLRELALEIGAVNVKLAGPIDGQEQLEAAYGSADLFVLPCVRAENGDLDGLPTVILEAMAAGVPVVTTDAANIPDLVIDGLTGFVGQQRDVDSLVDAVRRALAMPPERRAALVRTARRQVEAYANPARTTDTLLRLWRRVSIDIVLVTFDRAGHRSQDDTFEIIDRLLRFTSVPFSLTIVDNRSDPGFLRALSERYAGKPQVDVVPLWRNVFCGPATNIGFGRGRAPYAVYVCSNEGFVLRHGWDHQMIRTMERTGAAMAGSPVELGAYRTGAEMSEYPSFKRWRAREFALEEPERLVRHVQGGLFILRRDVFESSGGFNRKVPQDGTDVEYSYYLESLGHRLAAVPGLVAVSVKTRPPALALVDEFTVAVHPSRASTVGLLDSVVARSVHLDPVCGWSGPAFDAGLCPECGSSPFSRTVFRLLGMSGQLQGRPRARVVAREGSLGRPLERLCSELVLDEVGDAARASAVLAELADHPPELLVVDRYWPTADSFAGALPGLVVLAERGVLVAVAGDTGATPERVRRELGESGARVRAQVLDLVSGVCSFDPYPLLLLGFPHDDGAPQGIEC